MNNRGWGLQAMILWCAVLGLLLIFATIAINGTINNMYGNNDNRNSNGSSVIKKEDYEDSKDEEKEEDTDKKEDTEVDDSYEDFLDTMVEASKKYIKAEYNNDYANADHLKLSTKMLINNNYMDRMVDPYNSSLECVGYIAVDYVNNELIYEPYLKCGDAYETEGFIARHAE